MSYNPHSIGYFNGTPWYYHDTRPYVGRITLSTTRAAGRDGHLNECKRISAFVQDNLSLGKRLTLNLGLRFDKEWASRPEEIRKGYVDPNCNGLSNVLLPDLFSTQDMIAPALKNFMVLTLFQPRVGLSFDIFGNGKTAFKASFASYYDPILAANLRQRPSLPAVRDVPLERPESGRRVGPASHGHLFRDEHSPADHRPGRADPDGRSQYQGSLCQ